MQYLNLDVSDLDSEQMIDAEPIDRGTWLFLQRYCVGQENSGRIVGARKWPDRKWQQIVRVSITEVNRMCALWRWDGDDLITMFYPSAAQVAVQAKRSAAHSTNRNRRAQRSAERPRKGKERKERKGMEGSSTLPSVEVVVPSHDEFLVAGRGLGLPDWRIEDAWLNCRRDQWRRRNGLAMDYRLELEAVLRYWRSDGCLSERLRKNGPVIADPGASISFEEAEKTVVKK
jgi:hypothetical protein